MPGRAYARKQRGGILRLGQRVRQDPRLGGRIGCAQPYAPARFWGDEHRRDHHRVALISLSAVVVVVGGAHVVLDIGGGKAGACAVKGDDLGNRRAQRAAPAQRATRPQTGAARRRTACPRRRPRRSRSRTGDPGGSCRPPEADGERPRRRRAGRPGPRSPTAGAGAVSRSRRRQNDLSLRSEQLRAAPPAADAHADRALAVKLHVQHGRSGADLEIRTLGHRPKERVGAAETPAAPLIDLEHRDAVLLGAVVVGRSTGCRRASLAAIRRRSSGRGERCSLTRSGPPAPCHSDAPRTLSSDFRKYGRTSRYPQPAAPCAAQLS